MMYNQGDILLIPIPFSDLSTSKQRPVVVLSNSTYNCETEDIIVAAITSNLNDKKYSILINYCDMKEGNLKVASCLAENVYPYFLTIYRVFNHIFLKNVQPIIFIYNNYVTG